MANTTIGVSASCSSDMAMEDDALKKMEEHQKQFSGEDEDEGDEINTNTAVASQGRSVTTNSTRGKKRSKKQQDNRRKAASRQDTRQLIHSQMMSYKERGSYQLPEDVYAFITAAPFCSMPFVFACGVIGIKYIVYGTLLSGINFTDFDGAEKAATAVKFFLIPVAVAMQEDLMAVYAGVANARYDSKVLEISEHATKLKFGLSYFLRVIDGFLSLTVNLLVMLSTNDVLGVFLNFAALHFLQDIDDVFYALVEKGFFGDGMEHMAMTCKQITWPRRRGTNRFSVFLTDLDTILFSLTLLVCMVIYIIVTKKFVLEEQ